MEENKVSEAINDEIRIELNKPEWGFRILWFCIGAGCFVLGILAGYMWGLHDLQRCVDTVRMIDDKYYCVLNTVHEQSNSGPNFTETLGLANLTTFRMQQ